MRMPASARPGRRIGRAAFAIGATLAICALLAGQRLAEAALPALARLLNPYGINAGLAVNAILIALGGIFILVLALLLSRRLADAGLERRHDLIAAVALAGAAIFSDQVFLLTPRLAGPAWLAPTLVWLCLLVAAVIIVAATILPTQDRELRD